MDCQEWNPTQYFHPSKPPNPFALLILNQPINERAFADLHSHARFTVCADGGANRYFDMMRRHELESTKLPNAVVGDLDSIRSSVRDHYTGLGVQIVEDGDQYSTDFTKCLRFLRGWFASTSTSTSTSHSDSHSNLDQTPPYTAQLDIVILGGLGGRVDQAFSQIHHLYSVSLSAGVQGEERDAPPGNLYLVSEESITFVLRRGRNVILTPGDWSSQPEERPERQAQPDAEKPQDPTCLSENIGLIPLTGPTRITTRGFQWDVESWRTVIGGDLSTSNHIRGQKVEVECEEAILFTVELAGRLKVERG